MAYNFANASKKYLSCDSAPVSDLPVTIAAWIRPSSNPFNYIISLGKTASPAHDRTFFISSGTVYVYEQNIIGGSASAATASAATADAWSHITGVWQSTTSRTAYLNGVAGTTNTQSVSSQTLTSMRIGGSRISESDFFNGDIADVGIWNVALTAAEIASLAAGVACSKIRPQSLQFYAPLVRDLVDVRGGRTITNNNSAAVANHPRLYL